MDLDVIVVLSKVSYSPDKPDWILQSRLDRAIEVWMKNPQIEIVLSGGISHHFPDQEKSEAVVMKEYLEKNVQDIDWEKVIIDDKNKSTVDQIVNLKIGLLVEKGYKNIGLVTDEIHMPRALATAEGILGDEFKVIPFAAEVNIGGIWRQLIEKHERDLLYVLRKTRLSQITKGDHSEWKRLSDEFNSKSADEKKQIIASYLK